MTSPPASQPGGDAVSFQAGSPEAVPAGLRDGEQLRQVEREIAARRPEHQVSPSLDRMAMLAGLPGDPQRASQVSAILDPGLLTEMERVLSHLVAIFGDGRVLVRNRLGDAIEAALSLVETAGGDGGPAGRRVVLVTGSVVTAGEARQLLAPGTPA